MAASAQEHVFAVCAYKDSPYLEACVASLEAQMADPGVYQNPERSAETAHGHAAALCVRRL